MKARHIILSAILLIAPHSLFAQEDTLEYIDASNMKVEDIIPWWERKRKRKVPDPSSFAMAEIHRYFPVQGITLTETFLEEIEENGHDVTYRTAGFPHIAQITRTDLMFMDADRDHVVEQMKIKHIPFPENWKRRGFDWKLSYNQWIELMQRLRYKVTVVEAPSTRNITFRFLHAVVEAVTPSGELKFTLNFTKGEKGSTTDSPYTLNEVLVSWIGTEKKEIETTF